MPKSNFLLAAAAALLLSANAALADTKADDRSYLPPQDLQVQHKLPPEQPAPQAKRRLPKTHYRTVHTQRHYVHRNTRRYYVHRHARRSYASRGVIPGPFFSLF